MRKPVLPRIVFQCFLYFMIFLVIIIIQFSGTSERPGFADRRRTFDPGEFVIPEAAAGQDFAAMVSGWHSENYSIWSRQIAQQNNEDLVISFIAEALSRANYRAAISAIPASFLNGNQRAFESAVFLGHTEQASRMLAASDREKLSLVSGLIETNSPDLLNERSVFNFLHTRGHTDLMARAAELIASLDPETIRMSHVPGIFEGYMEWNSFNSPIENPFGRLIERACALISISLRMNSEKSRVFVIYDEDLQEGNLTEGNLINTEYNLLLAGALLNWAEHQANENWAALARSIILSVLSLENQGSISAGFIFSPENEIIENPQGPRLLTAYISRMLGLGDYKPKAVPLGTPNNVWALTLDQTINASMQNNILNISVSFPPGESHYMIIRGIRPFEKIQIYGLDYPSDPQFERYDSSGWRYLPAEATLLVKMRHRSVTENILIYY